MIVMVESVYLSNC